MYHPIIINMKPKKKNMLPINLDFFPKNIKVLLTPIRDTIPIKKDI